jgi:peptide/nickel transport system permease protein
MGFKLVLLWTDVAVWALVAAMLVYAVIILRSPNLRASWGKVFQQAPALSSSVVLLAFLLITLLDSVHFRAQLPPAPEAAPGAVAYDTQVTSLLDVALQDLVDSREKTYSLPLSAWSFTKEPEEVQGQVLRQAPRLRFGGAHLANPDRDWSIDVLTRAASGALLGLLVAVALTAALVTLLARSAKARWGATARYVMQGRTRTPWRAAVIAVLILGLLSGAAVALMNHYHLFGTDVTGNDVFYQTLKSIRTAFVIGALSTLFTLPLAVVLGILGGYYRGWVDDLVQYVYTVLSSIPNILLIAACVLMVQVFLDKNADLFETAAERADLKLFLLCAVLGLTGWAGLCRLLRAETLKVRELEFVQAADGFGVKPRTIMWRHIFPNVAHLMLIVTVLEFSSLILYEAVLALVGVGVDPSMNSFGGMINYARNEMSRDPVVWWPFLSAFVFMVALVLAANLFADGVRDAFDPRARSFRPRVPRLKPRV